MDTETDAFDFLAFFPETSAGKNTFLRKLSKRTLFPPKQVQLQMSFRAGQTRYGAKWLNNG